MDTTTDLQLHFSKGSSNLMGISLKKSSKKRKRTKFTDMPVVCLEKILENLNINDLVEVARTNRTLKYIADRVFQLNHAENVGIIRWGNEAFMKRIIKTFGKHIIAISMELEPMDCSSVESLVMARKILKMIIKKCRKTLNELTISETYDLTLDKPFENLQVLIIKSDNICEKIHPSWLQYNRSYPNLRKLSIDDICHNINIDADIVGHIPKLEELCLLVRPSIFTIHTLADLINVNRHVKKLQIWNVYYLNETDYSSELAVYMLNMAIKWEYLNVSELDIEMCSPSAVIFLENVKKLNNLKILKFNIDYYPGTEYTFSLDELNITTSGSNTSECIDFIMKHQLLKKLTINTFSGMPLNSLSRIAHHLKDLKEFSMYIDNFNRSDSPNYPDVLIEFFRHCKLLRSIKVIHVPNEDASYEELKNILAGDGSIPYDLGITQTIKLYKELESKICQMYKMNEWKLHYIPTEIEEVYCYMSDNALRSDVFMLPSFYFVNETES